MKNKYGIPGRAIMISGVQAGHSDDRVWADLVEAQKTCPEIAMTNFESFQSTMLIQRNVDPKELADNVLSTKPLSQYSR